MRVYVLLAPFVLFGGMARADIALVSHGAPDVVRPVEVFSGGTGAYGIGGFVPRGARRPDGTLHPGAGTGFGIAQALSFANPDSGPISWKEPFIQYVEPHQLSFDGKRLTTRSSQALECISVAATCVSLWMQGSLK